MELYIQSISVSKIQSEESENGCLVDSQAKALKHISALKEGDISLISGGPGTGKTFLILQAMNMLTKT